MKLAQSKPCLNLEELVNFRFSPQIQDRRQDFVAKHGKYVPSSQVAYKSWESSRLKVKPASTKIINGGQTVKNVITGATPRNSL